jgi:TIR domain
MGRKVFVSYCHKQGTWVWDRLVPILTAGGSEVLIDRERFEAGKAVVGQMDAIQDRADVHVLLLSADYIRSSYCVHEMRRAVDSDPLFKHGKVVPVRLDDCRLPPLIKKPNPLHVDLRHDAVDSQWDLLLDRCGQIWERPRQRG